MSTTSRSNKVIIHQHAAITLLTQRTLPTLTADLKAVALIKRFYRTPVEVIEGTRDALKKRLPEGWASNEFPADLAKEWTAFLGQSQEMPEIPTDLLFTKDDMPKALKTGLGEANRQGVADIILALGDLYQDDTAVAE